jgi:hypothetical protein
MLRRPTCNKLDFTLIGVEFAALPSPSAYLA